jgi:hypothetical protein
MDKTKEYTPMLSTKAQGHIMDVAKVHATTITMMQKKKTKDE